MKKYFLNRCQRGISLLEVMLSLAIISVILVMATRYFGIAGRGSRINQTIALVGEIKQGTQRYVMDGNDPSKATLQNLADNGYISQATANITTNAWGGAFTPKFGSPGTLTLEGLPNPDCGILAKDLSVTASKCSAGEGAPGVIIVNILSDGPNT